MNFNTWQELAKHLIDGNSVIINNVEHKYEQGQFVASFCVFDLERINYPLTIEEKPTFKINSEHGTLCDVWDDSHPFERIVCVVVSNKDGKFVDAAGCGWDSAKPIHKDDPCLFDNQKGE